MKRDISYSKRDPAAAQGDLCADCKSGDHTRHVFGMGSICVGCACGWKPAVRVMDRPDLQALIPGGDDEPVEPKVRAVDRHDPADAIQPPGLHHLVLACGRCDRAITWIGGTTDTRTQPWIGHTRADPCDHLLRDVPVWAMNEVQRRANKRKPKKRRAGT